VDHDAHPVSEVVDIALLSAIVLALLAYCGGKAVHQSLDLVRHQFPVNNPDFKLCALDVHGLVEFCYKTEVTSGQFLADLQAQHEAACPHRISEVFLLLKHDVHFFALFHAKTSDLGCQHTIKILASIDFDRARNDFAIDAQN